MRVRITRAILKVLVLVRDAPSLAELEAFRF